MSIALKTYHRLPSFMRSMVASLRGYHLRHWRFGAETDRLVAEALEREGWTDRQWEKWQADRLARALHRAANQVPYYRSQWQERRRKGDSSSVEDLNNWPVLKKESLRENPQAFLADDCRPSKMFPETTSGTTGKPLKLWFDKKTIQAWSALFEARWRQWYGVTRHDRWAILGGQLVVPARQIKPPFWVWNHGLNQLYLSSYHLSSATAIDYLRALRRSKVVYLWGYPSSMYTLAKHALELGLTAPKLKFAISNAEPFYVHQREAISAVFQCPVYDTYGMAEIVSNASECRQGRMHLWPESGITEILDDDRDTPLPRPQTGRLVCTSLLNQDMPFIRYEVGDRGALETADRAPCPCGRTLPILKHVEGRKDDVVLTLDGRRIGRLDPVFKADLHLQEAQIIQESRKLIRLLVVPSNGFSETDSLSLCQRLRDRMGDMEIEIQKVDEIPRSANGKFRAVLSKVDLN